MPGIWLYTIKTIYISQCKTTTGRGPPEVERDRRVCGCLLLGLSCNEMEEGDEILEDIARLRD